MSPRYHGEVHGLTGPVKAVEFSYSKIAPGAERLVGRFPFLGSAMTKLMARTIIGSAGLLSTAGVAATGHDGWGWILFVTFLLTIDP